MMIIKNRYYLFDIESILLICVVLFVKSYTSGIAKASDNDAALMSEEQRGKLGIP